MKFFFFPYTHPLPHINHASLMKILKCLHKQFTSFFQDISVLSRVRLKSCFLVSTKTVKKCGTMPRHVCYRLRRCECGWPKSQMTGNTRVVTSSSRLRRDAYEFSLRIFTVAPCVLLHLLYNPTHAPLLHFNIHSR